jgi:hypothetical protein
MRHLVGGHTEYEPYPLSWGGSNSLCANFAIPGHPLRSTDVNHTARELAAAR